MIEFVVLALAIWGLCWLWTSYRAGRWDKNNPRAGEQWDVVELRDYAGGCVWLVHAYGRWGVKKVPDDEGARSTVAWFDTEQQARSAFAKVL